MQPAPNILKHCKTYWLSFEDGHVTIRGISILIHIGIASLQIAVFKRSLFFWFSSEFHHEAFYIGRHQREIDVQLTRICVPHDSGRRPRSLEDMKH